MDYPKRLLWALGVLTLLAGTSISVAQSQAATPRAQATEVGWGVPQPLAAGQPHSEPAHQASGLAPHLSGTVEAAESTNWSGYVDTAGGTQFTAASGQWVVPSVQPSQTALYSATWIGVDGAGNSSLIQTGTAQDTSAGATDYFAWFEILPDPAIRIGAVSPGDHMQASVEQGLGTSWVITITDVTSGATLSEPVQYNGPLSSAEWIEEAPTVGGQQSALANFGSAQFTNISERTNPSSSPVTHNAVDMIANDSTHTVIASAGPLANNSFTITDTSPAVIPAATSTTISVNPTSTTFGSPVTYAVSVTSAGGTPTGSVTVSTGSTALCTVSALVNGSGSCSASTAPAGNDTITASYPANSNFAASRGSATLNVNTSGAAPTSHGYWLVGSDGGIFTFGSSQFYGSTGSLTLQRPVVGMTLTSDRRGYWLVASDGGVFTFGDAGFFGSIPGMGFSPAGTPGAGKKLNAPIVGMVPSPDGAGYFMVASDGGVFAFGDAKFEGSCPGIGGCSGSAVTVMPDASGNGYWLVTATGQVYNFGDAATFGAPGPQSVPVTSAVRTPDGRGYWILFANGAVDAFGDAPGLGAPINQTNAQNPATAIFATTDGQGYWVTSAAGAVFTFGDAPNYGGLTTTHLNGAIIAGTGF
jgi:hypothetical protein